MYTIRTFLAIVVFALTANYAHAQEKLDFKVGTRFTYIEIDRWKKEIGKVEETVLRQEGENFIISTSEINPPVETLVNRNGAFTKPMPYGGGGSFTYTPVKIPLQEGVKWEYKFHYVGKNNGNPGVANRQCVAGVVEEIEVPAGKFSARKYECTGDWRSGVTGTSSKVAWFAPSIGVVVKSIDGWRDTWTREETTTYLHSVFTP
jgi:hypothetical protein